MAAAKRDLYDYRPVQARASHVPADSVRRAEAESFIRSVFARRYGAEVSAFAPNLLMLEQGDRVLAAAGWRSAAEGTLFLERYLDRPIQEVMARRASHPVERRRIVEVGHLAAERRGGTIQVIRTLAAHFDHAGYEWVVFTATTELVGIFTRLGLPLLALAPADPRRLGGAADAWGSYYDTRPIVVAGRIRLGLSRPERHA